MLARLKRKSNTVRKEIVNNSVRICVECGSTAVLITSFEMHCKDCSSQFRVKKGNDVTEKRGGNSCS